jgi:hypothetical protein
MKHLLLFPGMLLFTALAARGGDLKDVNQLAFMSGCWAFTEGGSTTEEYWTQPAGGTMMGLSRVVAGGKTVFTEYIQMREQDGVLTMFVQLKLAEKSTAFKLTKLEGQEAVFTTGQAWPRQLAYKMQPDGTLFAKIEGTQNGKEVAQIFPYRKTKCQ